MKRLRYSSQFKTTLLFYATFFIAILFILNCGGGGGSSSDDSTNQTSTFSAALGSWSGDDIAFTLSSGSLIITDLNVEYSGQYQNCKGGTITYDGNQTTDAEIKVIENTFTFEYPTLPGNTIRKLTISGKFTSETTSEIVVSWEQYDSICDTWHIGNSLCYANNKSASSDNRNGSIPNITDVRIFRQNEPDITIDSSNGPIVVYLGEYLIYKIYYSDPDVDVDLLHYTAFYPSTRTEPTVGPQIKTVSQSAGDDIFTSEPGFFGFGEGEWRLNFQLEDSAGNKSNIFNVLCEVRISTPNEPQRGTAPIINDVRVYREAALETPIDPTNGAITVTLGENLFYKIFYEDPDIDVDLTYFWRYYPSTRIVPTFGPDPVITRQSAVQDIFTSEPGFFGFGEGEWRLEFLLEDSFSNQSDIFTIYVNVIAAP
jgi:hypothetical protein